MVEMLMVITIIGLLMGLLLKAVQGARHSARKVECVNNLRNISTAFQTHIQYQEHLPTGGWGPDYTGDPDAGYGRNQPGGWVYNILPYLDNETLHDQGKGSSDKKAQAGLVMQTPLPVMNCPSRRAAAAYPYNGGSAANFSPPSLVGKSDYAANAGTVDAAPGADNGIINKQSEYTTAVFSRDGASNTIIVGEKYLQPEHYLTGVPAHDGLSMYQGFNINSVRWGNLDDQHLYLQDKANYDSSGWGSAHDVGAHFAFGDNSVSVLNYDISPDVFRCLLNRQDGRIINLER